MKNGLKKFLDIEMNKHKFDSSEDDVFKINEIIYIAKYWYILLISIVHII